MDQTVRELAYKLWQVRSLTNTHTTADQDWYDAEKMFNENLKEGMILSYEGKNYSKWEINKTKPGYIVLYDGKDPEEYELGRSVPIKYVAIISEEIKG